MSAKTTTIAVMLPNWIGDAVMATPALLALREHFSGQAKLVGVMRPVVAEVLAGQNWFDETILYNRRSKDRSQRFGAVARQLRAMKIDSMILLPNSLSSATLAWWAGAKRRIGYWRRIRSWLLTDRLMAPRNGRRWQPQSPVDQYLRLVQAVGCSVSNPPIQLVARPEDDLGAELVWKNLGWSRTTPVVLLNTGSANGAARNWPVENFVQLAQRLVAESNCHVLALCGPAERATAKEIETLARDSRVRSMADQDLSIGVMKGCIRRSQVMVTTDSGPRHIAAAFGLPTVTLSGPIDPRWSQNYHRIDTVIRRDVPCSPCGKKVCPLQHHCCMKEITVDEVLLAVRRSLLADRQFAA